MLRSGAGRSLLRSATAAASSSSPTLFVSRPLQRPQFTSQIWTAASKRPQALATMRSVALRRQLADQVDKIDYKEEAKTAAKKIEATPDLVSTKSSVHRIRSELGEKPKDSKENSPHDSEMLGGIKSDLGTIRETFSLQEVPKEAYWIGLAGVLPYFATSLGTVYCAFEINRSALHGTGLLLTDRQAELFLHVLEPLQIGYGATIISFLGAIHWGLEFAGYGGRHGYSRYAIGVVGAALAWPTILLPAEYALITQFLIFNFFYYTDSRASKRGWAPPWYGVYRFVLTFLVGSAIVVSLVGRGQIADRVTRPHGPAQRIKELRESQAGNLEAEEKIRRDRLVKADETDEEEEEAEEEEDDAAPEDGDDDENEQDDKKKAKEKK